MDHSAAAMPQARLALGWRRRLPMVLQTEAAECGLACLAMLAGFHGAPCEISELRRRLSVSLKGVNLADLVRMAERIGFASRPLRVELDELRSLSLPCIVHWEMNHFVVLDSVGRDSVVIHDPAVGVRRLSMAEASKLFTGVALELTPTSTFEPAQGAPRVRMRSVLGRIVGLRGTLLQLFGLALAIEVFAVISPFFMQWVVDHALMVADRDLLLVLALGFGLLMLLRTTVSAMRGWIGIALGATLKVQSRANLFTHLVGLPTAYFEARHTGDVMSRFGSQESILQALTTDVIETVLDGLLVVITLAIMFAFAPALTGVVLVGAAAYGILRWVSYMPLRHASVEAIVWGARRDSHFLETMRGIKTIKLFNGQERRRAQWLNLLVETVNRQLTTQKLRLLFRIGNSLIIGSLVILVVWMGAMRVLDGAMTVGMLLAFIAYKDQFLSRISNLIDRAVDLTMLRLHAERLADIALTAPEPREVMRDVPQAGAPVSVEVRDLRFRYSDNDPWVIDGLNLRIEAGETVAIVGSSGCGKTTLLKILASLLQPVEGEVLVDGVPLKRLGIETWRSMIGVVMQDDQLFAGSLADNICFFADAPDLKRVEDCARAASLHDEIMAMPMGYHTLIGDMGTVLSGGQKQRVLIARALYRNPGVLLLDEATSHLDLSNERTVSAAIRATAVTRIIIAHRPETIRSADRVIDLATLRRASVAGHEPAGRAGEPARAAVPIQDARQALREPARDALPEPARKAVREPVRQPAPGRATEAAPEPAERAERAEQSGQLEHAGQADEGAPEPARDHGAAERARGSLPLHAAALRPAGVLRKRGRPQPDQGCTALDAQLVDPARWMAWDAFVEAHAGGGFMQSSWWARFREPIGFEQFAVILKSEGAIVGGALVARWRFAPGRSFYYIQDGPLLPADDEAFAAEVFDALLARIEEHRQAEGGRVSHLRIEPRWRQRPVFVQGFVAPDFADAYREPRRTLCLDLRLADEALLAQMKPKGRYNIRVAQRHGVLVEQDDSEQGRADFLRIYRRTTTRHAIDAKPPAYFHDLLAAAGPQATLFFAEYRGRRVATALVIRHGRRATYFFGGSMQRHRQVMAPYLLHYEIARWARSAGCDTYDLWGVAPPDQPLHRWAAISEFKRKFGGEEIDFGPTLDRVYDAETYARFRALQRSPEGELQDHPSRNAERSARPGGRPAVAAGPLRAV